MEIKILDNDDKPLNLYKTLSPLKSPIQDKKKLKKIHKFQQQYINFDINLNNNLNNNMNKNTDNQIKRNQINRQKSLKLELINRQTQLLKKNPNIDYKSVLMIQLPKDIFHNRKKNNQQLQQQQSLYNNDINSNYNNLNNNYRKEYLKKKQSLEKSIDSFFNATTYNTKKNKNNHIKSSNNSAQSSPKNDEKQISQQVLHQNQNKTIISPIKFANAIKQQKRQQNKLDYILLPRQNKFKSIHFIDPDHFQVSKSINLKSFYKDHNRQMVMERNTLAPQMYIKSVGRFTTIEPIKNRQLNNKNQIRGSLDFLRATHNQFKGNKIRSPLSIPDQSLKLIDQKNLFKITKASPTKHQKNNLMHSKNNGFVNFQTVQQKLHKKEMQKKVQKIRKKQSQFTPWNIQDSFFPLQYQNLKKQI